MLLFLLEFKLIRDEVSTYLRYICFIFVNFVINGHLLMASMYFYVVGAHFMLIDVVVDTLLHLREMLSLSMPSWPLRELNWRTSTIGSHA